MKTKKQALELHQVVSFLHCAARNLDNLAADWNKHGLEFSAGFVLDVRGDLLDYAKSLLQMAKEIERESGERVKPAAVKP